MNGNNKFVPLCSFIALLIVVVYFFLDTICQLSGEVMSWIKIFKDLVILIGISVPAFGLIRNTHAFWKVLYWIFVGLYIAYLVCMVLIVFGLIKT